MDSLVSKSSSKAVRQTLKTLPKDLDNTYGAVLCRIENQSDDDKQLAHQILQWISFAVRPLELTELQAALAVEPEEQELDTANISTVDSLISVCAGLVVFDQDSKIVRLVHFSTQEYFKRVRFDQFPEAQNYIGNTCLRYLCFKEFESGPCSNDSLITSRIQNHPLFTYAAEYWGEHVRGAPEKAIEREVLCFLKQDSKVSASVQVMYLNINRSRYMGNATRSPRNVTGLHIAARFGLVHIARTLINQGVDVSATDSYGATALHRAAEGGYEEMVRLLLESGAEIEAKDPNGYTALHQASKGGITAVVLLLLQTGAKISEPIDGRTALHFAAEVGSETVAELLLGNGAEVTAESKTIGDDFQDFFYGGRTPLHWAAVSGSISLVRLLLKCGAKVNAINYKNRTPLQEAIMNRHVEVAATLLENGASVTIMDANNWTPLHEAAWKSPPIMSEILLDYNADTTAQSAFPLLNFPDIPLDDLDIGNGGCTPLQLAAASGRSDVFEVLKARGASLTSIDAFGFTTIDRAIQANSVDIIRSLLNAGVNVDTRGGVRNETPLHRAARQGMTECISYLLEQGADIMARDTAGESAIQIAEAAGKKDAVRALLSYKSSNLANK
ncbi:hypothetical protein EAE96_006702 [Botrytis aclada]|nr:hypothetical protein EAE96_006702 [Botrytis aclada]